MPIPRLQSATSTTSLQRLQEGTINASQLTHGGGKLGPLGLKKAYSNVDVGPSSQHKAARSRTSSLSNAKLQQPKISSLQKSVPSTVKRTTSSGSVKNATPSPVSSPRRGNSSNNHTSPDRKGSSASQTATSPTSPSEGSEVSLDQDLLSQVLSSSSEGEVGITSVC